MLVSTLIGLMSQKLIPKRLRKAAFFFGGKHELQRKGLVLDVGFMRPLLVWRGYWIDGENVMSDAFMGGVYDGDSKRQEMASDATIRDYFAAKAMQGMLSNPGMWDLLNERHAQLVAKDAYIMADAMLKARNQ